MEEPIEIFERLLKKYIPEVFDFSGLTKKSLKRNVEKYKIRINNLQKLDNLEESNYTPHCIFDLVVIAENDTTDINRYKQFLEHINRVVKSLIKIVDESLHKKLKEPIKQMITSVDEEIGSNYQYLNFYGEILGLEFFLAKSKDFKLIDIERKLPNRKSVDFVFKDINDLTPLYVDFISFHNIKPVLLETNEDFIDFFEKRIKEKIDNKTKNLEFDGHNLIINGSKIPFLILPIIWGDMEKYISKKKAIEIMDSKYSNVSPLTSLMIQESSEKVLYYDFTTISNIIERIIEEKK